MDVLTAPIKVCLLNDTVRDKEFESIDPLPASLIHGLKPLGAIGSAFLSWKGYFN